jgi:CYTH domain-containing protein
VASVERPPYSRWEHERRFVVRAESARFLADEPFSRLFEDRYLSCGLLRLRRITEPDSGAETFKLTKKYASDATSSHPIVTIHLSREEHAALSALAGAELRKRRFYDEVAGRRFSVDVFEGPLAGLVLCEIEVDTAEELARISPPAYAGPEVTDHPFFTGGGLARARPEDLARALERLGIARGA